MLGMEAIAFHKYWISIFFAAGISPGPFEPSDLYFHAEKTRSEITKSAEPYEVQL